MTERTRRRPSPIAFRGEMLGAAERRRQEIVAWMASLKPAFELVDSIVAEQGWPACHQRVGPACIRGQKLADDYIRISHIWIVSDNKVGFRIDFYRGRTAIEVWSGRRAVRITVTGYDPDQLRQDLTDSFANVDLTAAIRDDKATEDRS